MAVKLSRFFAILALSIFCMACGAVKLAAPDRDSAAKQFNVADGYSNIYIYRNEDVFINTEISVDIDGRHAGNTDHKTFILKSITPGKHTIIAHAENTDEIELITVAGKNHFIWLEARIGVVINRAHLHSVNEKNGRAGVMECRLVE